MKGVYACLLTNERLAAHCSVTLSLRCGCCRVCRAQLSCCSQWTVTVQYSGCAVRVQCVVWHPTKRFSPWSPWPLHSASKDEAISLVWVDQARPQWLQTTTLIKVRVISASAARENIHGDMRGCIFSKILFITHILSKCSCKKSPWKMRPSNIV